MTGGSPVAETTSAAQRATYARTPAAETMELPLTPPGRPRAARRRTWLALAAVVVAAAAGVGAWLGTRGSPRSGTSPVVTTTVVAVTTGTMRRTVASSGTLEPAHESELSFAVPGVVTAVDVAVGQAVAAGDRLATVAPTALEATEQSAAAALSAAEAQLASDRSGGAAASQIESDEAAITSAESQLSSAQGDVADATLTSPISGTVAAVNLSVGQHVGGTADGGGAPGGGTTGGTSTSGSGSTGDASA
jgi:membrane fusion protein, macrolide-specific efflux system